MLERYSIVGIMFSIALIAIDLYLVKRHKIEGRMFVLWFIIGALISAFSIATPLIFYVRDIFGTQFEISSIMAAGFLFFLIAIFYLHYRVSELRSLLMKLTMEVSAAKYSPKKNRQSRNMQTDLKKRPDNETK